MTAKRQPRRRRPPHDDLRLPNRKKLRLEALVEAAGRIASSRQRSHLPFDVYSLRPEVIAERCGVSIATAMRWKLGQSSIPYTAAVVLAGDLGASAPEWQGWRVLHDALISPEGERISKTDLVAAMQEALQHGYSSMTEFAKDLQEQLGQKAAHALEEQPHPPEDSV